MSSARHKRRIFEQEALPHMDALYGAALRMTASPAAAEDLVQETLLRAFVFFDSFQPGTNCRAWLFRIQHNLFVNQYRRRQREREHQEPHRVEQIADNIVDHGTLLLRRSPEATLQRRLISEQVVRALDALPEEFRLAVVLADLHDFSYKEIAGILECPVGTVMSRIFRGRRLLRETLAPQAAEHGIGAAAEYLAEAARRAAEETAARAAL